MLELRQNGHASTVLEFYPQPESRHRAHVPTCASLFASRGVLIQAGDAGVAQRSSVRWCSDAMDGGLLSAGRLLVSVLHGARFASAWLGSKLMVLGVLVAPGALALKRPGTARVRRGFFPVTQHTSLYMPGAARMHHPLVQLPEWLA